MEYNIKLTILVAAAWPEVFELVFFVDEASFEIIVWIEQYVKTCNGLTIEC